MTKERHPLEEHLYYAIQQLRLEYPKITDDYMAEMLSQSLRWKFKIEPKEEAS